MQVRCNSNKIHFTSIIIFRIAVLGFLNVRSILFVPILSRHSSTIRSCNNGMAVAVVVEPKKQGAGRQPRYTTKSPITTTTTKMNTRSSCCGSSDDHGLLNTTVTTNNSNTNLSNSLIWKWATHNDTSFHHFTTSEATAIREALLSWYRTNRRKLPWRGDPPPYDGSTAGIATSVVVSSKTKNSKKKKKDVAAMGNQKKTTTTTTRATRNISTLHNYFATKETKHQDKVDSIVVDDNKSTSDVTPVTAYGVWVSEIMLQQTRVEAVIPYWIRWMKSFPTVEDLAKASDDQVNAHWAGLGFYRRARLLHQGAKYVVSHLHGQLPTTARELQELIAGIGPYTAAAISSIAFGECVPVVDGNVCRVLSRLRGIGQHIKAPVLKDRYAWDLAKQIVEAGRDTGGDAGEVNQALMELGATYCAPAASGMDERDPLKPFYMSTKLAQEYERLRRCDPECLATLEEILEADGNGEVGCKLCDAQGVRTVIDHLSLKLDELVKLSSSSRILDQVAIGKCGHSAFPTAPPKLAKREEVLAVLALKWSRVDDSSSLPKTHPEDRWLLVKRPNTGLLAGQWEFPSVCVWTSEQENNRRNRGSPPKMSSSAAAQVPIIEASERSKALSVCMEELLSYKLIVEDLKRHPLEDPVEHIFSHVRHTMWIEMASIQPNGVLELQWIAPNGREVRWMNESDMKSVGVTSGVKRIIKTVNQFGATKVKCNKRKR